MSLTYSLESLPELLGPADLALLYKALDFSKPGYQYPEGEELRKHIKYVLDQRVSNRDRSETYDYEHSVKPNVDGWYVWTNGKRPTWEMLHDGVKIDVCIGRHDAVIFESTCIDPSVINWKIATGVRWRIHKETKP